MQTMSVRKTSFVVEPIIVTLLDVRGVSRESIRAYAIAEAGETPGSLFGSKVEITGNVAVVSLYRD